MSLRPEMCLFINRRSSNACIMVLSKLAFVLHSFLHYCVGDDLRYARYGFSARLGQVQCYQGCFLHYSLLEMWPQEFEELEAI